MLKIDTHTHILPERWPDLKERYGYGGFAQLEHLGPGCSRMVVDGKAFRDQLRATVDQPRLFCAILQRATGNLVVIRFVGLP
jgi:hypothetical protein